MATGNVHVRVWEELVTIPTYGVGKAEKNPMFFEKRVYQGSSGVVYPNAVIEKILDKKTNEQYKALFLENAYLKVMILPQLGGRIQMAYDKIGERHFIYYNQVIKPALVGLTGPWISGGIEFNWPQHHRPSTFEPIDYMIEDAEDGKKTVWVNEIDRMFHTKALVGFSLYEDRAYIEISANLYNRTATAQTFLWWANPAVKVGDDYQSVFPTDVNAVFDHGRRDVSDFPIATGTYYKVDYSPGTDISRYKNIPVPTSYMAVNSAYDFVGGYEHDSQGGLLHVADHHVSTGKKQWTWGYGDFGQAWDRNLTDEDGPYIELMTGVYADNQPDFSWLMPYETKTFTQYFLPYRKLGMIKNASKDILLSIETGKEALLLAVQATSLQPKVNIQVSYEGQTLYEAAMDLDPRKILEKEIPFRGVYQEEQVVVRIHDGKGRLLLCFEPGKNLAKERPEPASAALPPQSIQSAEELFLTGQHLEQYRHATYSPLPYYEEGLRRDPGDSRCNNALGSWYLRRGQFKRSEPYFRAAIERITARNPNPYDSEPYYNLGLCLQLQGRLDEAYDAFYKATWSKAWKDSGYFALAQIALQRGERAQAIEHLDVSLHYNAGHSKAYLLKIAALRLMEHYEEALQLSELALKKDRFNLGVIFEKTLIYAALKSGDSGASEKQSHALATLQILSRGFEQSYLEYALDYMDAGLYRTAVSLLESWQSHPEHKKTNPMICYYLGYGYGKSGDPQKAAYWLKAAATADSYLCFPNRLQEIGILEFASQMNNQDAKAPYYLGNLYYDKRQYEEAIKCWELSIERDKGFATVYRNLGLAYFNKQGDQARATALFEQAFRIDTTDARILMELDQLYKRINKSVAERSELLDAHPALVEDRDDLYLERIAMYNFTGDYESALGRLRSRKFHPWEGGEGKVSGQYVYGLVGTAKACIWEGDYQKAIDCLTRAQTYPENLGEGKLYGKQENDIFYWLGCAYEGLYERENEMARSYFEKATAGKSEMGVAMYYNDQQPDMFFYQALACEKLGEGNKARTIFQELISYGLAHQKDRMSIDYFAVSLPNMLIFDDDLDKRNQVHCLYIQGLGLQGIGDIAAAVKCFQAVLGLENMHFGAKAQLDILKKAQAFTFDGDGKP